MQQTVARLIGYTAVNVSIWYATFGHSSQSLRELVERPPSGAQTLDTTVFPVATTTILGLVVALALAILSSFMSVPRNAVAYALGLAWCFTGAAAAREMNGSPNRKVNVIIWGLLAIWLLAKHGWRGSAAGGYKTSRGL